MAWWFGGAVLLSACLCACAPKRVVPIVTDPPSPPAAAPVRTTVADPQGTTPGSSGPADPNPQTAPESGAGAGLPVFGDQAPAPPESVALDGGEPGTQVAELARTQVGKPYGWGATGPERFDCSGLATYVYRQLGIALPRMSLEQASTGTHVERSELKPGDLVFFSLRSAFDHVGIFLGNNRFVHAPRRQEPVRVDNLDDAWWNRAYRGARRVFGGEP